MYDNYYEGKIPIIALKTNLVKRLKKVLKKYFHEFK